MQYKAANPDEYIAQLPEDRQAPMRELRETINANIPDGFQETMSYGMIGWVVPHSLYPPGYHCEPKLPLPFMSIASQKNFIGIYHMGIYADESLMKWFVNEYPNYVRTKLDMGKSCIRMKKPDQLPFQLFAELARKMTPDDWISLYESQLKQ